MSNVIATKEMKFILIKRKKIMLFLEIILIEREFKLKKKFLFF